MAHSIKIYGERNTGTNYLRNLIRLNLNALQMGDAPPPLVRAAMKMLPGTERLIDIYFCLTYRSNLGWKHTQVKPAATLQRYAICKRPISFVTITKNPYSWLLSLHRKPYHQYYSEKPSFEEFLQLPWKTVGRDNTSGKVLSSPIELWNLKNASYLQLPAAFPAVNLTSEGILESPGEAIALISNKFSIARLSDEFVNHHQSTKDKTKDTAYYREYYLNERWKQHLSREAIAVINSSIDKDVMLHFGYPVLA